MKKMRLVALMMLGSVAVSGCSNMDIASRNAPFDAPAAKPAALSMKVTSFQVRVPRTLKASEANLYYPSGDIVWREDPLGDRHAQVQKIFEESLAVAVAPAKGSVPVLLDVEVKRFHALTEKARYTTGGRHEMIFVLNFLNPETLQPIAEPRRIETNIKAFGGQRAIHAEQNGITQRLRISQHIAGVVQRELGIEAPKVDDTPHVIKVQPAPEVSRNAVPLMSGDVTNSLF
ncbi:DUF6778 family protein [Rhodalgimonas zhirmunskyi]|uniref:Lipoprotein n=1 Tax=Rhodalgimonas zhirmunskyi TaxID=2964767 RepID=A0AAJ1X4K5_9RHOB|nr:DUF6778 family protein [Rhodoalgimonas zhirmunskyi]MDQ2093199.1 hypothetical protein [Rhodoalgimonas zhirmunskyi]